MWRLASKNHNFLLTSTHKHYKVKGEGKFFPSPLFFIPQEDKTMPDELLVLGSAAATPTGRRFASAYALKVTGKLFLIDCGAPVSTLLYRYGLDPVNVQAVFLSHWHMDHVANLGLFLTQNRLLKRSKSLRLYGPRGTLNKVNRILADTLILPEKLRYKLEVINVQPEKTYKEALLRANFFMTEHLERPALKTHFGRKATAYGMIFSGPGWRVLYSGDLNSPQELGPYVQGVDLLVHEMAHHKPEVVAEFAEAAQIPHVLVTHLRPEYDESPEKIIEAFKGRYSGDVTVAEDGTRLQLSDIRKLKQIDVTDRPIEIAPLAQPNLPQPVTIDFTTDAFLNRLMTELDLSVDTARQVVALAREEARHALEPESVTKSGQVEITVIRLDAPTGVTPTDDHKTSVTLTLDAWDEDTAAKQSLGSTGLRRKRLLRLQQETIDQGGILTQEELARLLNVSVRTVRRDMNALKTEGYQVATRGTSTE
jgi:ribonuclease BN (tRNA processing enzyme)